MEPGSAQGMLEIAGYIEAPDIESNNRRDLRLARKLRKALWMQPNPYPEATNNTGADTLTAIT